MERFKEILLEIVMHIVELNIQLWHSCYVHLKLYIGTNCTIETHTGMINLIEFSVRGFVECKLPVSLALYMFVCICCWLLKPTLTAMINATEILLVYVK
jgi:hypothetical protein